MESDLLDIIRAISDRLTVRGQTLAVAESCTGGFISNAITDLPGASRFFLLGAVCYSAGAKQTVLGVSPDILSSFGAVSEETAAAMAEGIRKVSGATFTLATTGVAGPDPVEGKEVGLVHISCAKEGAVRNRVVRLSGGREEIKRAASLEAVRFLRGLLASWE